MESQGSSTTEFSVFSVKGKIALVTGASSGLGERFAVLLAKEGANVVLAARRADRLAKVVKDIEALNGGKAVALSLDVGAGEAAVNAGVDQAWEAFGRIDILVNNAGIYKGGPILEETAADWNDMLDVNLKGAWQVAKAVAKKQMADGKGGSIVNVSSCFGNPVGVSKLATGYSVTKAALQQLTRHLAQELGPHGIRVNSLSPGMFPTEINSSFHDAVQDYFKTECPIPRVGNTSHDLDGPLLLLASDAGAYMTGSNLTVDGGLTIGMKSFVDALL